MEEAWQASVALTLLTFVAFFFGFALGRRRGKREGFEEGIGFAPLELRKRTWENGRCLICGSEGSSLEEKTAEVSH